MEGLSRHSVDIYILAVHDAWLTRVAAYVVASLVVYDYLLSLSLEVELIWKKPWSIIKVVFLWHRYFGFFCVIFQCIGLTSTDVTNKVTVCSVWFRWELWATPVLLFSSEIVIILWIWIIYNKSKQILGLLLGLFAGEVGGVLFVLIKSVPDFSAGAHAIPGVTYCLMTRATILLRLLWVPILCFDSSLLALYLYKGFHAYHDPGPKDQTGVLRMVYKHSLLNFLAIFASYLTCAVIWVAAEPGLAQIPVGFALSLSISNCTRLLLNIRRAYYIGPRGNVSIVVLPRDADNDDHQSSTTPIIEWNDGPDHCSDGGECGRVELAESLLLSRETPDPRRSVEMKIATPEEQRDRWQYELRTMQAK